MAIIKEKNRTSAPIGSSGRPSRKVSTPWPLDSDYPIAWNVGDGEQKKSINVKSITDANAGRYFEGADAGGTRLRGSNLLRYEVPVYVQRITDITPKTGFDPLAALEAICGIKIRRI